MLDKKLLEILVCPLTKGALEYQVSKNELWSKEAKLAYAVRDDIPILIPAEARKLSEEEIQELTSS